MTTILFFYGKFVAASLMLLALYWGVLRGRASYRQIRLYLLLVPVVSLMMSIPRYEVWRPSPTVVEVEAEDVNIGLTTEIPSTLQAVKAVTATYVDGQHYEVYICLSIAFVSFLLLLVALFNLLKMCRLREQVEALPLVDGFRVVHLSSVDTPFSFRDTIFLPQGMTARAEDYILRHEQSHVRHRHYVDVWLIELLTRLLWFNPVLWLNRNELRSVHEFEADHEVALSGVDIMAYQSLLVEYTLKDSSVACNGFSGSLVRRRFVEMRRGSWGTLGRLGHGAFAVLFLLLLCSFTIKVGDREVVVKVISPALPGRAESVAMAKEESNVTRAEAVSAEEETEPQPAETASDAADDIPSEVSPSTTEEGREEGPASSFPLNTSKRITYNGYYIRRTAEATYLVCVATPESDDEVYHLGSHDNTCIVDVEHGVYYRARGAVPSDAWEKDFHVKDMKGKTIALSIVFPPMPDDVEHIRIFGVGHWNLRGQQFRMKDIEEK